MAKPAPSSGSRSSTEGPRLGVGLNAVRGTPCLGALLRDVPDPLLCDPRRQERPFGSRPWGGVTNVGATENALPWDHLGKVHNSC